MAETLGALLAQQAGEITGRERERAQLRRLLEPDGPVVAYVHGLAGVGKTTLLHAFAADAREAGAVVVELDGHVVPAHAARVPGSRSAAPPSRRPPRRSARAASASS